MSAGRHITTQIKYFYDNEEDTKYLTQNTTEVLTKHLGGSKPAKIIYGYHPVEKKVEIVIIEHR